ncbi:hypothetical protein F5144DRAFT_588178 [Chaetomium tenue]|uniref:Uncharacterized protein n=1 Tax=Chaetomium tenue TaxID=1854479 RepID=A0ACB7PKR2_9PEZI|nr:hypothetical protein F5144DRAFT_588178 [Chaetomium globosum]
MVQADQPRRNLFSTLLTRPAPGTRSEGSTNLPPPSAEYKKDELKGPIGLTTIYEPPSPEETAAEIVFIHGLGGGSRKTWCYSSDPEHYWPQSWLPADKDFIGIRIHVFGYKGDWLERRESVLGIHDFGQSLIDAIRNHPGIPRVDTRIILVGHSMGGCVAKKAYILARQDPATADIARRMHSMFFLATPHRGSNMAAILENMLAVGWGKKPFVTELTPNSAVLSAINDTFRHFAPELWLWSFYETLPMRGAGFISRIIVDKHSGTLGYPKEEITGMEADHRQVCKFESPADPNYKLLRNALATAVDLIQGAPGSGLGQYSQTPLSPREARERLSAFLEIQDAPEDDLDSLQNLKQPGSCQWFTRKATFASWKCGASAGIFWLLGRPGAGKSVLASHVVEDLRHSNHTCSYFMFKHNRSETSTLHHCFRSLAFQMAIQDDSVKEAILQLARDGISWDEKDESSVWKRLFTNCITKVPSVVRHFWVLDGIDECSGFSALFEKRLLSSLPQGIRLFATSRGLEEIERGVESISLTGVTKETLLDIDTLEDIRLFATAALSKLTQLESDEERQYMLVLQDLAEAWTKETMDDVLDATPTDLFDLYSSMVKSLDQDKGGAVLAKSLLTWVVLACRPLTVDELTTAINLDTNQTLRTPVKAIPELSGQLLFIDDSNNVQILHETAREFLLSSQDAGGPLLIDQTNAHTRLGSLLLKYIADALATPRDHHPTTLATTSATGRTINTSLLDYAFRFFSEHIYLGNTKDDQLVHDMFTFFQADALLSWIQHIATHGNLAPLIRTAMNLRAYLNMRNHLSTPDEVARILQGQITEILHIAASSWDDCVARMDFSTGRPLTVKYGESHFAVGLSTGEILLYHASSLRVEQQLQHPEGVRLLEASWYHGLLASCSAKHLVVWDIKVGTILYSFPLRSCSSAVVFLGAQEILCASERCELTKWSLNTGEHEAISWVNLDLYNQTEDHNPFPDSQPKPPLSRPNRAAFLNTADGILLALGYQGEPIFIWDALEVQVLGTVGQEMIPTAGLDCMVFHPNLEIPMLLVAYQPGDLCVFDYNTMEMLVRRRRTYATAIACSPYNQRIAIGNAQGAIEVFDLDLGGAAGRATLTLIYRASRPLDDTIRSIALSADGLRFVDIRNRQARVWAPMGLMRRSGDREEDQESSVTARLALPEVPRAPDIPNSVTKLKITSPLVASNDGNVIVAGKSNGDVVLFSAVDGREILILYQHTGNSSVVCVVLVESRNLVISANDAGRVVVAETTAALSRLRSTAEPNGASILWDRVFDGAVSSLIVNAAGDRVLVNGRCAAGLWELPSGGIIRPNAARVTDDGHAGNAPSGISGAGSSPASDETKLVPRYSCGHPTNPDWFILVSGDIVRIYAWADFAELTKSQGILLARDPSQPSSMNSDKTFPRQRYSAGSRSSYHLGSDFVVELFRETTLAPPRLYLWPLTALDPFSALAVARPTVEPPLDSISPTAIAVLDIVGSAKVLFLDVELWVCSVNLGQEATGAAAISGGFKKRLGLTAVERRSPVQRHFFALSEWRTLSGELRCTVAVPPARIVTGGGRSRDVVAFAVGDRAVLFHGGFQFSEDYEIAVV